MPQINLYQIQLCLQKLRMHEANLKTSNEDIDKMLARQGAIICCRDLALSPPPVSVSMEDILHNLWQFIENWDWHSSDLYLDAAYRVREQEQKCLDIQRAKLKELKAGNHI